MKKILYSNISRMRTLLCTILLILCFHTASAEKGPCSFRVNRVMCTVYVGKVPVQTTVIVHHCHQPIDVTFIAKSENPAVDWRHTFVTTNSAENQEIPGFEEKVLLHVTLSNRASQEVLLKADYHHGQESGNFFLDTTLHLKQLPDCKQLGSSNVSHIVAGVMMPLLLLVLAVGGTLLYCKCRKSALDRLALVDNVAGIPGAIPYQEGNPRIEFNKKGHPDNEVVIENCFVTARHNRESEA